MLLVLFSTLETQDISSGSVTKSIDHIVHTLDLRTFRGLNGTPTGVSSVNPRLDGNCDL